MFNLGSCTPDRGKPSHDDGGHTVVQGINDTPIDDLSDFQKQVIKARCIVDRFSDGAEINLYGRHCIENRHLFIRTSKEGEPVATSLSLSSKPDQADGLRTEGDPDFITKVYDLDYQILKGEGDDNKFHFLRPDLLVKQKKDADEKFYGSKNTKYKIIFKTVGDHLVLYKASKKLEDIPHTERSAIPKNKKGNYVKEAGYYKVPFLGYKVEYCRAKAVRDTATNKKWNVHNTNCNPDWAKYDPKKQTSGQRAEDERAGLKETVYLKIHRSTRKKYAYQSKKDFIPADYFNGQWFYSEGEIETYKIEGELGHFSVKLVEGIRQKNKIHFRDSSGVIKDVRHRDYHAELPVIWSDYEMNQHGGLFVNFGEKMKDNIVPKKSPYLQIDFEKIKSDSRADDILDVLITPSYFSYVLLISRGDKKVRKKYSYLRKGFVSEEGFKSRKWFLDDSERYFGILPAEPQHVTKLGDRTIDDRLKQHRMIRFHTDQQKTNIVWYLSKNSTKDPFYLQIAREAVNIYNQAFQKITREYCIKLKKEENCKIITLELKEKERKDLGDSRYNIINLFKTEEVGQSQLLPGFVLFGLAPSYVNPNTGQVIGATANIILHNLLEESFQQVKDYTRYEIFQKKRVDQENSEHVVDPILKALIEKKCSGKDSLINHIQDQASKYSKGEIKPEDELGDKDLLLSCGKKIYKISVLTLILHEMGHNFGLSHNFKASVDEDNYYNSIEEIKQYFPDLSDWLIEELDFLKGLLGDQRKPFKTSSVMDYFPVMHTLPVLGKYDLANLRYLYLGQVEDKSGGLISLDIPENLDEQKPLSKAILSERKKYLHCSDEVSGRRFESADNFLCVARDYGSNPLEIVKYHIQTYKRVFNSQRYRYDNGEFANVGVFFKQLNDTLLFHNHWLGLRDLHFQERGLENYLKYDVSKPSESDDDGYLFELTNKVDKHSNYYSYYKTLGPILDFYLDVLFMESMKCEVEDQFGKRHIIDLELIKTQFNPDYVENCYSKSIKEFLADKDLKLIGQRGIEDLKDTYYYSKESLQRKSMGNIWSFSEIYEVFQQFPDPPMLLVLLAVIAKEPHALKNVFEHFERRILEEDGLSEKELQITGFLYSNFKIAMNFLNGTRGDHNLILSNLQYFKVVRFAKGTHLNNSFYRSVVEPMRNGQNLELPFIEWAYKEHAKKYKDSDSRPTLQDFIVSLPGTLDLGETFIVPFNKVLTKEGGFMERVVKRYNKSKRRIAVLEAKKGERNFMESIELKRIQTYNQFLLNIIAGIY